MPAEALGVAVAVDAGAALVYSTRVTDAVEEYPRAAFVSRFAKRDFVELPDGEIRITRPLTSRLA